jgi:hypothetical protein
MGHLKAGDEGVFTLLGPALVKYSVDLASQETLVLLQPPAAREDDEARPMPPSMGGVIVISPATGGRGEIVVVLLGDQFFSIEAATLNVIANTTLPKLEPPSEGAGTQRTARSRGGNGDNQPGNGQVGPPPLPPMLELHGRTLYVQRGPQIMAINILDGTMIGQNTLPKPPEPVNN